MEFVELEKHFLETKLNRLLSEYKLIQGDLEKEMKILKDIKLTQLDLKYINDHQNLDYKIARYEIELFYETDINEKQRLITLINNKRGEKNLFQQQSQQQSQQKSGNYLFFV